MNLLPLWNFLLLVNVSHKFTEAELCLGGEISAGRRISTGGENMGDSGEW